MSPAEAKPVPRFYFDTKVSHRLVPDPEGLTFHTESQAIEFALASTAAFAEHRICRDLRIEGLQKIIRGECGRTITAFTFAEALRRVSKD